MKNCNKPEGSFCAKECLEKQNYKFKRKIEGNEEINSACAFCKWYSGYISNPEIKRLRTLLDLNEKTFYKD